MMLLPIVQVGNPTLSQVAKKVPIDLITSPQIKEYIISMQETMHAAPGVGLAAPQVGIPWQIIVIEDREEYMAAMLPTIRAERGRKPIAFHVIINPVLTWMSEEQASFFEGCLSVKNCSRITSRAKSVLVNCLDENAEPQVIQATGWYARILQHEIDHVLGTLYIEKSDKRTEIILTEENRKKWLNASADEINAYFKICCNE